MTGSVSISARVPREVAAVVDRLAAVRGLSLSALIRRAIGVLQSVEDATAKGRSVGVAADGGELESVIVGPCAKGRA